jgi:acetyl-CoA carboxylase, biotin carboxylase subunit
MRVFVANRGEIAVRIVQACQKLGFESVLGASEADRDGLAARLADRVVQIGPAPASESYLRPELIVHAALGTGCDAIHPGYGFLSESPRLAAMARANGLRFVGPPTEVIELAGDKLRAREIAAGAGVPIVPGGDASTPEEAERIGYPMLLKAAGGGGGRGIKRVSEPEELRRAFAEAAAEARAAFGDERLYVERFVGRARHIEVQIVADQHGAVVALGERDCSVQRRYQKLIEEAPASLITTELRGALTDAALRFARAVGYQNLGTVEFIIDADTTDYFFLEVNCRIQVEHPVTEVVTDRDLVALQLQIATGKSLDFVQDEVVLRGHAIECRLNAEDVTHGFMPSPGTLSVFAIPERPQLRVDTHCFPGAAVPPYYDSLLAKLIAHGSDRDEAAEILLEALEDLDLEGVESNRTLLISVLGHPDFRGGAVRTDWLERVLV